MGVARAPADHCIGLPSSHFPPLPHLRLAHWGALPSRGQSDQAECGPGGHIQGSQEAVGSSVCDTWPRALPGASSTHGHLASTAHPPAIAWGSAEYSCTSTTQQSRAAFSFFSFEADGATRKSPYRGQGQRTALWLKGAEQHQQRQEVYPLPCSKFSEMHFPSTISNTVAEGLGLTHCGSPGPGMGDSLFCLRMC